MVNRFRPIVWCLLACLCLFSSALPAQESAVVGVPYSFDFSGGLAEYASLFASYSQGDIQVTFTYSFTIAGGRLPPGLSLKSSGLLSGTPTSAGQYDFSVTESFAFTVSSGGQSFSQSYDFPFPFTIVVTGGGGPKISVQPGGLSFSFTAGAVASSQFLSVANQGNLPRPFSAAASAASGGGWLSVSGGGTAPPFGQGALVVTADPARLPAGTYVGSVAVSIDSPPDRFDIPVVMTVSSAQQSLGLSQIGLTFRAAAGGGAPPAQSFAVLNGGGNTLNWTVGTSTLSGGASWLSATPGAGSSSATASPAVQVQVKPAGLAAGDYYGQVQVSADGVANSPQAVSVVLTVLGPAVNPPPVVLPTGLIFVGQAGGANPASQTVEITNLGSKPLSFSSSFDQGTNWVTANPKSGSVVTATPTRIAIQPALTGLAAGVYRGEFDLLFTETATTRRIDVLLIVIPAVSAAAKPESLVSHSAGGCAPTKLIPVFTQLGATFTTTAAWPTSLEVRVVDDCGTPMISGSVVATFSSGDPLVALTNLRDGRWSGTWQPRAVSATPVTITAKAQIVAPALAGTSSIGGSLQPNLTTPVIAAGGAVSAASFAAQAPLAPGSLISIAGSNLAQGTTAATDLPLKTELNGTQALLGGRALPLQSTSDGQIIAIVPFDVPINVTQQMIVRKAASYSVPEPVIIAAAQPAVFTTDLSGKGAAVATGVKADGTQFTVDADHPLSEGDTVIITCAGLGPVDPAVDAGAAGPASSQTTNTVTVTIGGQPATVVSAGLAPDVAGIYLVTATVPGGITPAPDAALVVAVADQSSPPVTIAVQAIIEPE
jgi:large repetitive protein